jgi:hypothetical protein
LLLSLWLLSLILSQQCVANAYLFLKKGWSGTSTGIRDLNSWI